MIVKTNYFYTLSEICGVLGGTGFSHQPIDKQTWDLCGLLNTDDSIMKTLYQQGLYTCWFTLRTYSATGDDKYINDIWNVIYTRFYNEDAISFPTLIDEDNPSGEFLYEIGKFFQKLTRVFDMTKVKYTALINFYSSWKTKLMDGIKSTSASTNRQNDTPLNGGDYSDDPHTSFITQGTGEAVEERDSPIARLDEVNNKMAKLYLQWSNEFERIFLEG